MIISDFAKLAKTPISANAHKTSIKDGKELIRLQKMSEELREHACGGYSDRWVNEHTALSQMISRFGTDLNDIRQEVFVASGAVPRDLLGDDPLSLASQCPRITLEELHRLANVLGFVIIPYEYLKDKAWNNEEQKIRWAIDNFSKVPIHKSYVLCPVDFYDVEGHINHEKDMPIYPGTPNQQAFMALSMTIPSFRAIKKDIRALDERVSGLESRVSQLTTEIRSLTQRVEQLAQQVNEQQRDLLLQQAQQRRQAEAIEELAKRLRRVEFICAHDPLMVNLHENQQITDKSGIAIVGPCWGSDFDAIVTELLELKKVKGQRAKVRSCFLKFSNN